MSRRSPSTWPAMDMTPQDSRPTSTIATARRAWPGASRITRISRSTSTRSSPATWPWATGSRSPNGPACWARSWRNPPGARTRGSSRGRGSMPRAPRLWTGRSWVGSPGSRGATARSLPSSTTTMPTRPMRFPTDRSRASASGPRLRGTARPSSPGTRRTRRNSNITMCGWPSMFTTIASRISIGGWGCSSRSSAGAACSTTPW